MNNSKDIHSNKLQVILEFLFFLRDKTIDIINLLNDNSILFFQFLANNAKEDIDENNDDKNRINYKYINDGNIEFPEMKRVLNYRKIIKARMKYSSSIIYL